jgi:membrane protease YdiL (CAAX protease family)
MHPAVPLWLVLPGLLALALIAVRWVAGLSLPRIGLRPWGEWTTTERSYFLQVVVLANVVFPLVLGMRRWSWGILAAYFFFGFYQEVVYRGMVQLELVRRWGAVPGVLTANALYTLGPLHANYYAPPGTVNIPMLLGIFLVGLFFGVVCHRSGNLWIVAMFHGIGNAYMVGSLLR